MILGFVHHGVEAVDCQINSKAALETHNLNKLQIQLFRVQLVEFLL